MAQVETQSSDLGNTVSGKEISQLELNGRDFTQLVTLSPGVTDQSGQDEGGEGATTVAFSINGGRTEYNNFEIDGGDALDNGSNTTLNVYPSIDAIAEVKVLTSNYGAQYGKNGSGTVEVETKSGTNRSTGTCTNSCATTISMRHNSVRLRCQRTRRTILALPSAVRFTFRATTTPISRKHFSSGRKNGGASW